MGHLQHGYAAGSFAYSVVFLPAVPLSVSIAKHYAYRQTTDSARFWQLHVWHLHILILQYSSLVAPNPDPAGICQANESAFQHQSSAHNYWTLFDHPGHRCYEAASPHVRSRDGPVLALVLQNWHSPDPRLPTEQLDAVTSSA